MSRLVLVRELVEAKRMSAGDFLDSIGDHDQDNDMMRNYDGYKISHRGEEYYGCSDWMSDKEFNEKCTELNELPFHDAMFLLLEKGYVVKRKWWLQELTTRIFRDKRYIMINLDFGDGGQVSSNLYYPCQEDMLARDWVAYPKQG